jgi:nucleotide-binding universal stress UspA family protein
MEEDMFRRILVPLDRSALAEQALDTAAAIARESNAKIDLIIAHPMAVYDGSMVGSWGDSRDPQEVVYIRRVVEDMARRAGVVVDGLVATGAPVEVITRRARDIDADLIVMTSHGRTGFSRAWAGSVADGVVRHASVPVLMLRARNDPAAEGQGEAAPPPFHRILVPVDGSVTSSSVLPAAAAMAQCRGSTLILLRVVAPVPIFMVDPQVPAYATTIPDPDATKQAANDAADALSALARSIEHEYSLKLETVVEITNETAHAILDVAKGRHADLIAMTTHGRGASRLVIGSVADKVLRGSRLPLLLYHPTSRTVADPAALAASGTIRRMAGLDDDEEPTP